MLIRPAPRDSVAAGEDEESHEEGSEEVRDVTLSALEWDALHQGQETSLRRIEVLSGKLNHMGSELRQSFEMRTVLSELRQGVQRAHERESRLAEVAALVLEEILSRDRACRHREDETISAAAEAGEQI